MPALLRYPGVYIEETPSNIRTIAGVPTSVVAFIGRTALGPVDEPTVISNLSDFERRFGALHTDYPLSYAVRDFYLNGGGTAVILRLYKPTGKAAGKATLKPTGIDLAAATPGTWANGLRVRIDTAVSEDVAKRLGLTKADLFNLTVRDTRTGVEERFLNLTGKESARRADHVLAAESTLLRVTTALPANSIPTAHQDPDPTKTVWTDDKASTPVADVGIDSAALTASGDFVGSAGQKTGLYALKKIDIFNLLCIPPDTRGGDVPTAVLTEAAAFCAEQRAVLIVDPPTAWKDPGTINTDALGVTGPAARNAAVYFPRVIAADPLRGGQLDSFAPCGMVAGVIARTDVRRGVWKAPAGTDASLVGAAGLTVGLTDDENGLLNPQGINALRQFPVIGRVVWGARTLRGADILADEYKYLPVRRLALHIEESLYRGTQWVVFEPNDEPLWSRIRLNVGAFLNTLFRQGAFLGRTPGEAYFVKCDKETTPQGDIDRGVVNVVVGFAPLKPAEFVVIKIQQMTGQVQA